jgi:hypothetical protein
MKRYQAILTIVLLVAVASSSTAVAQIKVLGGGGIPIDVLAVENRSNCDFVEWFISVTNDSNGDYYRVRVVAEVKASVGPEPLCVEYVDTARDLGPGECEMVAQPFYNGPGQPCDDPCCVQGPPQGCNKCTDIRNAEVTVIAKSADGVNWDTLQNPELVFEIVNGIPSDRRALVNFCESGSSPAPCP